MTSDPVRQRIDALDGLRGLLALYVSLIHAYWLLGQQWLHGLQQSPGYDGSSLQRVLTQSLVYGYDAVLGFFVLSGLVIRLRYPALEGPKAYLGYARGRLLRLMPVMALGLAIALVLDQWTPAPNWPLWQGTSPYQSFTDHLSRLPRDAGTWWRTLTFQVSWNTKSWGSQVVYWSLGHEGFYYLVYPLAVIGYRRCREVCVVAVFALAAHATLVPSAWPTESLRSWAALAPAWWCGVYVMDAMRGETRVPLKCLGRMWVILPAVAVLHYVSLRSPLTMSWEQRVWYSMAISLGWAGVLSLIIGEGPQRLLYTVLRRMAPFGTFSYTLYVVHFPVQAWLSGWLMSRHPGGELPPHPGWMIGGWLLSVAAAYLLYHLVERPALELSRRRIDFCAQKQ
ncbi:MAG: hypothetical protein MOGMAGMI_00212 [Candidatus Omnitrophica bacterium]|nr:hypothetical protein [Candidatus Omnitrophota bacterium]